MKFYFPFVTPECFNRGSIKKLFLLWIPAFAGMTLLITGCQTTHHKPITNPPSTQEAVSALGTVTEGLTNQNISQKDLKNLAIQVQKNSQTRSAVSSINQALSVNQTCVKYCPVDGQRFDCSVDICPIHKVKLKLVE